MAKRIVNKGRDFTEDVLSTKSLFSNIKCNFCGSLNMNKQTLQCIDCKTVMPRNYGPHQRKDCHGNTIS